MASKLARISRRSIIMAPDNRKRDWSTKWQCAGGLLLLRIAVGWGGGSCSLYHPGEDVSRHHGRPADVRHPRRAVRRLFWAGAGRRRPGAVQSADALAGHPARRGTVVVRAADDPAEVLIRRLTGYRPLHMVRRLYCRCEQAGSPARWCATFLEAARSSP